jgi:hypothetical protein
MFGLMGLEILPYKKYEDEDNSVEIAGVVLPTNC